MFSNFKALLVAGVALPVLTGVALAQSAPTTPAPQANQAATIGAAAPSVKADTTINTPAAKAGTTAAVTPAPSDKATTDKSGTSAPVAGTDKKAAIDNKDVKSPEMAPVDGAKADKKLHDKSSSLEQHSQQAAMVKKHHAKHIEAATKSPASKNL